MNAPSTEPAIHHSPVGAMSALAWHGIARLRQEVFIVEQECAYPDLDGRDVEEGANHLWIEGEDGAIVATLRVLNEHGGASRRIGRVATHPAARGRGVMGRLLAAAIEACAGFEIEIEAQAHLQGWYERFGFVRSGDEFLEDGIPHVPMVRAA